MAGKLRPLHGVEGRLRHGELDRVARPGDPPAQAGGGGALSPAVCRGDRLLGLLPVPVLPPVEGSAGLRPRAGDPLHRGRAHLRGPGLRRRLVRAQVLPAGQRRRAQGGGRRAARRLYRGRAALGQPAL